MAIIERRIDSKGQEWVRYDISFPGNIFWHLASNEYLRGPDPPTRTSTLFRSEKTARERTPAPKAMQKKPSSGAFIYKIPQKHEFPEIPKKIILAPPKLIARSADGSEIPLKRLLERNMRKAIREQTGWDLPEARVEWPLKFSRIEAKNVRSVSFDGEKQKAEFVVKLRNGRELTLDQAALEATGDLVRREFRARAESGRLTI